MYAVEQWYFNSGRVITEVKETEETESRIMESNNAYDHYLDVFKTRSEAEIFNQQCLNA